ncbi:putative inositol monophosphatase 3 [Clonorchis sinensis]|uniref:Inositol monophosphatase 3 n=2 Tax=Clonorchis sinensis TaxID=79923 RepID=A0A8T1M157_CLOSI|nr:putative inositol monophosphatase 3 [Clonorchis sinensis]GAA50659.1 putative inositol monophosphatase 3 [Clonorchis sinensis]
MMIFRLNKHGWTILLISVIVLLLYYFSNVGSITPLHGNVISVKRLLVRCVHLTEDAGNVIRSSYKSSDLHARIKGLSEGGGGGPKNELLTDIDLKSHHIIVSGLASDFADLKVISEEHPPVFVGAPNPGPEVFHSDVESRLPNADLFIPVSDLTVWVDPLDATQELTEGLLEYVTVMVCVALHGHPIIGIIHQPFLNRTYWSWKSLSPFNSFTLSPTLVQTLANVSKIQSDSPLTVTHSRSHLDTSATKAIADAFSPQRVQFIPAGGSGFKVLSLIQRKAHLYVHPTRTRRWDVCAAQAVLESTGGRMTGLDTSGLTYDADSPHEIDAATGLFAAASVELHDRWKEKLSKLRSELHSH